MLPALSRHGRGVTEQPALRPQRCLRAVRTDRHCWRRHWLCPCPGTATGWLAVPGFASAATAAPFLSTGCWTAAGAGEPLARLPPLQPRDAHPRAGRTTRLPVVSPRELQRKEKLVRIDMETHNQVTSVPPLCGSNNSPWALRECRRDRAQNDLISDAGPSRNSCGQLPARGDWQQNFQLASRPCLLETPGAAGLLHCCRSRGAA